MIIEKFSYLLLKAMHIHHEGQKKQTNNKEDKF